MFAGVPNAVAPFLTRGAHTMWRAAEYGDIARLRMLLKAGGAIFLRGDKDRFRSRAELKLCTLSRNSAQAVWQHLAVEASCLDML